jgi:N-dimethylarginine dimethylaminohydrolase
MKKLFGGQSMVAPLRRVIVKRPVRAFRDAATIAREWRELNFTAPPDIERAEAEFMALVAILKDHGADILYLPEDERTGLDSIYVHDPALITDAGVVIFQPGKIVRRGEGPALADALAGWHIPVLARIDGPATVEGGDLVWLDPATLLAGRGFRTNGPGLAALRAVLRPLGVKVLDFDLPYGAGPAEVLHLMSFLSLLDKDLAVVHRRLLPIPLFELMEERRIQLVDIPEEEFPTLGCNVLALAPRRVVMLAGNPDTRERLEAAGCTVFEIPGAEIALKGSGGPTCLTRPLLRE